MSKSGRPPVDPSEVQLEGPTDLDRQRIREGLERAISRGAVSPTALRVDAAMAERAVHNAGASPSDPGHAAELGASKLAAVKLVVPALLLGAAAGVFMARAPSAPAPGPAAQPRSQPALVTDIDPPLPPTTAVQPFEASATPASPTPAPHPTARAHAHSHSPSRAHEAAKLIPQVPSPQAPVAASTPEPTAHHHLAEELRLMRVASDAISAKDFARALHALSDHAERYPNGALAEERRALRVISLCSQGRTHFALLERDEFLGSAPHSALAARVRASCEAQP